MTEEDAPESTETNENGSPDTGVAGNTPETTEAQAETFDRSYVEGLRKENANYRDRAKTAQARVEELCRELVMSRISATGRLADPTDLQFGAEEASAFLDDPSALNAAIDSLLEAKPHLASRRPAGDIGQGQRGAAAQPFNLLQELKARI
ncbi:hypothetical protein KXD96_11760 [Mycobacterium sp. SMC-2]|uniref:hypothetical protein n=1 Tax=Mycobacterium sp. SMC-2 TaxID=2857058 RepID=UPI0021B48E2F|nr:hypothetical protein [Mycobacterium sp. SMC-2]UXA08678.1 hypothetical protein KXD96_11760 [Mycobacterium sp. SMC-2]